MLRAVENQNSENVIEFPKCQTSTCRYAAQCPVREQLYKGQQHAFTSALFVGISDGKIGLNGLSNVAPNDVKPMMRVLGAALLKLCRLYKRLHATKAMRAFNLPRALRRRKPPSQR